MSITITPRVFDEAARTARPVAVSELKRAWTAVQAGEFRQAQRPHARSTSAPAAAATVIGTEDHADHFEHGDQEIVAGAFVEGLKDLRRDLNTSTRPNEPWAPAAAERVVPVVGAAGSVGCSTVAIAVSTAGASNGSSRGTKPLISRVVECSSAHTSGLAAASTAELGRHESGWVQGMREAILLERTGEVLRGLDEVATPAPLGDTEGGGTGTARRGHLTAQTGAEALTIIDTGWDIGQLAATGSWVGQLTRTAPVVIVVARPTIPGFRRLEAALELLEQHERGPEGGLAGPVALVAVVGRRRKRWAKGVEHSAGKRTRAALREDRVHAIPEDRQLAVTGLNSNPLPLALISAADRLLGEALTALESVGTRPLGPAGQRGPASTTHHLDAEPHEGAGINPEGTAR